METVLFTINTCNTTTSHKTHWRHKMFFVIRGFYANNCLQHQNTYMSVNKFRQTTKILIALGLGRNLAGQKKS